MNLFFKKNPELNEIQYAVLCTYCNLGRNVKHGWGNEVSLERNW